MAKPLEELREQLSAIEPDERTYAGLGPADVPALRTLLDEEEGWLAGRAVFALASVGDRAAADALREASTSSRDEVRVAVAASADRLAPELSDAVLAPLLDDEVTAVRKFAVRAVSPASDPGLRARVAGLARSEQNPAVRAGALTRAEQLGG